MPYVINPREINSVVFFLIVMWNGRKLLNNRVKGESSDPEELKTAIGNEKFKSWKLLYCKLVPSKYF